MIKNKKVFSLFFAIFLFAVAVAQPKQGDHAAEIALPAATGDTIRLSSLKGKVVLLDFWASWCGPCRTANKGLAKIYDKFRNKGFEIYSVSIDDDKADWQKAIKQDKIKWLQVNDPGRWNAKTAVDWNIYGLPTTYLIDKKGILLAMDLEGKHLEEAIKDLLED